MGWHKVQNSDFRHVHPASPPQQSGENQLQDRVLQIRAYLRDIFAEAVDQDFLVKDPARKVTVQTQLRDTDRTILTWPQLRGVLSKLKLRDRILLELDMTNALRPGELFALRWQCFNHAECTMRLAERVYKGKIRLWGKTRKRLGSRPRSERTSRRPCGSGSSIVPIRLRRRSSSRTRKAGSWTATTTGNGVLHSLET